MRNVPGTNGSDGKRGGHTGQRRSGWHRSVTTLVKLSCSISSEPLLCFYLQRPWRSYCSRCAVSVLRHFAYTDDCGGSDEFQFGFSHHERSATAKIITLIHQVDKSHNILNSITHPAVDHAIICLAAIFLPGLLLLIGMLPFWDNFRRLATAQAFIRGVNAAVVSLFGAAIYAPLWTSAINRASDFGLALAGFVLLTDWKVPSRFSVIISASGAALLAMF